MKRFSKIIMLFAMIIATSSAFAQTKGYEKSIELNGGIPIDKFSKFSLGITMINGYRFNNCLFLGAGVGYEYFDALYSTSFEYLSRGNSIYTKDYYGKSMLRLFGRVKANLANTKVSPYFAGDVGYCIDFNANDWGSTSGIMFEPQFGLDFKLPENIGLYAAVGYRGQNNSYTSFDLTLGSAGHEKTTFIVGLVDIKFGIRF